MNQYAEGRRILEGIRVVDITQLVAGPYCARMLGDLGADVTRIERPAAAPSDAPRRTNGAASLNLGKKAISLDLVEPSTRVSREPHATPGPSRAAAHSPALASR